MRFLVLLFVFSGSAHAQNSEADLAAICGLAADLSSEFQAAMTIALDVTTAEINEQDFEPSFVAATELLQHVGNYGKLYGELQERCSPVLPSSSGG